MTAIACKVFKDKIVLGADSRTTIGDYIYSNVEKKIFNNNGLVFGGAGNTGILSIFYKYTEYMLLSHTDKDDDYFLLLDYLTEFNQYVESKFNTVVNVELDLSYSLILIFNKNAYAYEPSCGLIEIKTCAAMGSGGVYALSALKLGKSVRQSIKFAIDSCTTCGGKIQIYEVDI